MSVLKQNSILDYICHISQAAKDQPISSETLESLESETNFVAQYLSSTPEAFLFSVVLSLYFNGREVEFNDLCRFFDSNPFEILPSLPLIDNFVQNGLLIRKGLGKRNSDIPF